MSEIYGHLWIANYGETPNKMWREALKKLSTGQIKYGLKLCATSATAMPNAGQFVSLCKARPDPERFAPALPPPSVDREKVRGLIKECCVYDDMLKLRGKAERDKKQAERVEKLRQELLDPEYRVKEEKRKQQMLEQMRAEAERRGIVLPEHLQADS